MRRFTKYLIPALLLLAVIVSCTVMSVSAAENVIYVSANGTGDGSSPDSPLGNANVTGTIYKGSEVAFTFNDTPYAEALAQMKATTEPTLNDRNNVMLKANALYRAFELLKDKDGTIVLVGEVAVDVCDRMEVNVGGPAEFRLPDNTGTITITSTYNGVDYSTAANGGAMFVLDRSRWNSVNLELHGKTVWQNVAIQHKYASAQTGNWPGNGAIYCSGYDTVFGDGIVSKSLNVNTNKGGSYIFIFAGKRYSDVKTDADGQQIVINSGLWHGAFAAGCGMTATNLNHGKVEGDVSITLKKAAKGTATNVVELGAGGFYKRVSAGVVGDVTLTVEGGARVQTRIIAQSGAGSTGDLLVDVQKGANVAKVEYTDGNTKAYTPASTELKYYEGALTEEKIVGGENYTKVTVVTAPKVVYIAANGKGDGLTPENPLGNEEGYTVASGTQTKNAFYRAFTMLGSGGTIVVVDDVAIDTAESRVEGANKSPSEFTLPAISGKIVVTSVYGGVDYREKGAEFILDQDACAVTFMVLKCDTTFENINILHKYNMNDTNSWGTPMTIAANGNKLVIEDTVKVSAWDASKNVEGNWYPMILGGHRYVEIAGDTDVTVKAGNWSAVYAGCYGMGTSYPGNVKGNATLNIEGGRVESVYGTTSHAYASGTIGGKLEINITGGYVDALYATAKNGAENEIVVNIAKTVERVAKVWGGTSDTNIPANAKLSYDRAVTRDDEVKYWAPENVTVTGEEDDQPDPVYYTLYVSNVEKGRGDGSSPENAIGHAADYYQVRAQALQIIAANGGTNSGLSSANSSIVTSVYKKNALYRALTLNGSKIVKQGGIIVVCDVLTIDSTDAMRKSLADFFAPTGAETITITSVADGVDYRAKGARLVLDTSELGLCVELGSPTVIDHLTIEHRYNSKNGKSVDNGAVIAARANKLTIGYDVFVWANDINPAEDSRVEMFPSICGGHRYTNAKADVNVTICSGNWAMVVGGAWTSNTGHTGNATIGIDGSAKIGTICGTAKSTTSNTKHILQGSVWIGLWGGEVDNVIVVAKPGIKWGDASIGLGGTKINGKVRATHADYSGEDVQAWVFNYTDKQVDTDVIIGFEAPVPATGSYTAYYAVIAVVALAGAALLVPKKRKSTEN